MPGSFLCMVHSFMIILLDSVILQGSDILFASVIMSGSFLYMVHTFMILSIILQGSFMCSIILPGSFRCSIIL